MKTVKCFRFIEKKENVSCIQERNHKIFSAKLFSYGYDSTVPESGSNRKKLGKNSFSFLCAKLEQTIWKLKKFTRASFRVDENKFNHSSFWTYCGFHFIAISISHRLNLWKKISDIPSFRYRFSTYALFVTAYTRAIELIAINSNLLSSILLYMILNRIFPCSWIENSEICKYLKNEIVNFPIENAFKRRCTTNQQLFWMNTLQF